MRDQGHVFKTVLLERPQKGVSWRQETQLCSWCGECCSIVLLDSFAWFASYFDLQSIVDDSLFLWFLVLQIQNLAMI